MIHLIFLLIYPELLKVGLYRLGFSEHTIFWNCIIKGVANGGIGVKIIRFKKNSPSEKKHVCEWYVPHVG